MEWGLPVEITIWELLNSQAISTLVSLFTWFIGGLIWFTLHRLGKGNAADIAEAGKSIKAKENVERAKTTEDRLLSRVSNSALISETEAESNWNNASNITDQIKYRIWDLINGIEDGRRLRKYNISNYDYREHIYLLAQDGKVHRDRADKVSAALSSWYAHKNRKRKMGKETVESLQSALEILKEPDKKL